MRRCFARVLLLMNLVGEESPRCLTLSADLGYLIVRSGGDVGEVQRDRYCERIHARVDLATEPSS